MKIASYTPYFLSPYSVTKLVPDDAPKEELPRSVAISIGDALRNSAQAGQSVLIATSPTNQQKPVESIDYKRLAKGIASVAGETITGHAVAKSAWQLSSLSTTTTPEELTKYLVSNHVAPDNAASVANDVLKVLQDPISKGVLIAVSAGAATYVVVQRTELSTAKKWTIIVAVGALAASAFALLRHFQIVA